MLDTVGEMSEVYGLATVVFVGGSLVRRGGQNPLEAARWAVPLIFGPHMENFREIAALFRDSHAALFVANAAELERAVDGLLDSVPVSSAFGVLARTLADGQRGALEQNLTLLGEALAIPPEKLRRPPRRCGSC